METETRKLPLNKLVNTYPFPPRYKIEKIKEVIRREGIDFLTPISCQKKGDLFYIFDGCKRNIAATEVSRELGINSMWAEFGD